jgi:4-alpha-glucanotransferase
MTWIELVDRLCLHAGIEFAYFDIAGARHEASVETKVLVLSALGFDVSSIATATTQLHEMEDRAWERRLAPFSVRVEGTDGFDLDLFLPAKESGRSWRWRLACDNGEAFEETFRPSDLALVGTRDVDGRPIERRQLTIGRPVPLGYHRLTVAGSEETEATIAFAPRRCYLPTGMESAKRRVWGLLAHLYTLRSDANWGVGDFSDLARIAQLAGEAGVSAIATNPFHALFPQWPESASPYSPSSRLFLNPLYIDIDSAPHAQDCPEIAALRARLGPLRAEGLVNYPGVWKVKIAAFEALYRRFQGDLVANDALAREVARFAAAAGDPLKRFAAFCAIADEHPERPWPQWPEELRHPANPAVQEFLHSHAERIGFHLYLQFLADRQLERAAHAAKSAGMGIGFVRDLALGINPDGADAWIAPELFASALRCGAPPDPFNPRGQEWGVLPLNPLSLRRNLQPYAALVAANMRHAGGLRIDHVIGLQRQFLVPLGGYPAQGCYVRFPFEEMVGILALESQRNRALVIGEDLGTVPPGFRDRMAEANALGCAILYFEKWDDRFKEPGEYRAKAAASASTHDLPTLAGWWEGRDIATRHRLGISPDEEADATHRERAHDRQLLLEALQRAGLFHTETEPHAMTPELRDAIHAYLARSSAEMFFAQIDDLAGEKDQINVPGTIDSYPNWRRVLSTGLEDPALAAALEALKRACTEAGRTRV